MSEQHLDRVVWLLVNGLTDEKAREYLDSRGVAAKAADKLLAEARSRLAVAAAFQRDEQVGLAIRRLEDLYAKSAAARDWRTALQAQRELNRLMSLYDGPAVRGELDAAAEDLREQLELIRGYLLPLGLVGEEYPVAEHARIAANRLARLPPAKGKGKGA